MSSDILVLGFDSQSEGLAALSVTRKEEDRLRVLKVHTGKEAELLYFFLTGEEAPASKLKEKPTLGVRWK